MMSTPQNSATSYAYLALLRQFTEGQLKYLKEEKLYAQGYALYQQGRYTEAMPFFIWLISLQVKDTHKALYYAALAACQKMTGDYEKAINHYAMALLFQPDQIEYKVHIAECQIGGQYLKGARRTLVQVLEDKAAALSPSAQRWLDKARYLLKRLEIKN
jgi:tetratricopeptide (TPR) repeat protein